MWVEFINKSAVVLLKVDAAICLRINVFFIWFYCDSEKSKKWSNLFFYVDHLTKSQGGGGLVDL